MPARRGRPRKGNLRIDKAIDHFAVMGYDTRVIRAVVADLLKLYGGGPDAWHLLEEGPYEIVQDRLFEIEDEEKQKQKQDQQQLLLEHHQQQDDQQVEDEPPQHQEPAGDEEVEDTMFIEPQDEAPEETKSTDGEVEEPMFIEQLAHEAALPLAAIRADPRRPCYGWLSESEDEEEKHEVHVLSPGERAL